MTSRSRGLLSQETSIP